MAGGGWNSFCIAPKSATPNVVCQIRVIRSRSLWAVVSSNK
jgi:hypothetical protein